MLKNYINYSVLSNGWMEIQVSMHCGVTFVCIINCQYEKVINSSNEILSHSISPVKIYHLNAWISFWCFIENLNKNAKF